MWPCSRRVYTWLCIHQLLLAITAALQSYWTAIHNNIIINFSLWNMSQNVSVENSVTMILFPDGPCWDIGIARREVNVIFFLCPDGFLLLGTKCMCDRRLNVFNATCYVDDRTILREDNNFWMMAIYENSFYWGLLLHKSRCPFDFCVETAVEFSLKNLDIQCNHNHSGILCGLCQEKFSIVLGTLHCLSCSNAYLALILVFACSSWYCISSAPFIASVNSSLWNN